MKACKLHKIMNLIENFMYQLIINQVLYLSVGYTTVSDGDI